jgi:hypothetical protein
MEIINLENQNSVFNHFISERREENIKKHNMHFIRKLY